MALRGPRKLVRRRSDGSRRGNRRRALGWRWERWSGEGGGAWWRRTRLRLKRPSKRPRQNQAAFHPSDLTHSSHLPDACAPASPAISPPTARNAMSSWVSGPCLAPGPALNWPLHALRGSGRRTLALRHALIARPFCSCHSFRALQAVKVVRCLLPSC